MIFGRKLKTTTSLYEIKDYFCITKIWDHESIKYSLLESIEYEHDLGLSISNQNDNISSTDFFSTNNSYYKDLFIEHIIKKYYKLTIKELGFDSYSLLNIWYQQYKDNDNHGWHNHAGCGFSNVYFLELPSNEISTEFLNPKTQRSFTVKNITEGDLLTFPGHIIHKSPKNKTGYRKTVIVFNSNAE